MILRHIGDALMNQALDERFHPLDMLGGARLARRFKAAKRPGIGLELRVGLFGNEANRFVQRQIREITGSACIDLVVHVSDVSDIGDVLTAIHMAQQAKKQVEHDDRSRIADMGIIVNGRAAGIDPHVGCIDRYETFLRTRQGIVEFQPCRTVRHEFSLACWPGRLSCLLKMRRKRPDQRLR